MKANEIRCRKCGALLGTLKNIPAHNYDEFAYPRIVPPKKEVSWTSKIKFLTSSLAKCEECNKRYIVQYDDTNRPILSLKTHNSK